MTKKKRNKSSILFILIFMLGLGAFFYPLISRIYYTTQGNEEVASFKQGIEQLTDAETLERLDQAYAYNSSLLSNSTNSISDPYSDAEKVEGVAAYAEMLQVNEKLGVVNIPKINVTLPIYAGTNESILQKGVGHLEGTSLPVGGLNSHSVITAHRGLPENKLFTDLDKMELGDVFYVESLVGDMAYKVVDIKVIEPTDFSSLLIEENRDLLTLLTCTPYMINSHRLLVIGERIELPKEVEEEIVEVTTPWWEQILDLLGDYTWVILVFVIILVIFIVSGVVNSIRKKRKKGKINEDKGASE